MSGSAEKRRKSGSRRLIRPPRAAKISALAANNWPKGPHRHSRPIEKCSRRLSQVTQSLALLARFRPCGGWSFAWLLPALLLCATASTWAAVPDHLQDHFSDLAKKVDD